MVDGKIDEDKLKREENAQIMTSEQANQKLNKTMEVNCVCLAKPVVPNQTKLDKASLLVTDPPCAKQNPPIFYPSQLTLP